MNSSKRELHLERIEDKMSSIQCYPRYWSLTGLQKGRLRKKLDTAKFDESNLASSTSVWNYSNKVNVDSAPLGEDALKELQKRYISHSRHDVLDFDELNTLLHS